MMRRLAARSRTVAGPRRIRKRLRQSAVCGHERIVRGLSGRDYSPAELRQVVRWVKSDGRLHTEEQLRDEVLSALRFQRRGPRITPAIRAAIEAERDD